MRDLLPIHRAIEFMESRLQSEVTMTEVAEAAGYSLYHFIRTFNQVARYTPYDYLMRRRLSEAANDLITSERRVVDIALDYGFNNHETFSRAFKRLFGLQPVQWRERGVRPRGILTPVMSYAYLEHIQHSDFQPPHRVVCPQRTLAGLMTPLTDQPEGIARLWDEIGRVEDSCQPGRHDRHYFGVTSYLDEEAFYLAGYEVEVVEIVMPPLVCQRLATGDYICMAHNAPMSALPFTFTYLYSTWLPKARLRPVHPVEIVDFGATAPWERAPDKMAVWLAMERMVGNRDNAE